MHWAGFCGALSGRAGELPVSAICTMVACVSGEVVTHPDRAAAKTNMMVNLVTVASLTWRGATSRRARPNKRAEPRGRAGALPLGRRQEHDLVLGRERNYVGWVLLLHAVDRPEQIVELARRRHPEQALDRLLGLVEQTMRYVHRQADQIACGRDELAPVDDHVHASLEHVDVLVLGWMNVRRHEGAGRKRCVPGERVLAQRFRHIGLAEDVPDDTLEAGRGLGDACGQLHE